MCSVRTAGDEDEILLMSQQGIMIRSRINTISTIGRATQGVKLMNLDEGDKVAACALVIKEEELDDDEAEEVSNNSEKG